MRLAGVLRSVRHRLSWYGRVHRCCRRRLQSDRRSRRPPAAEFFRWSRHLNGCRDSRPFRSRARGSWHPAPMLPEGRDTPLRCCPSAVPWRAAVNGASRPTTHDVASDCVWRKATEFTSALIAQPQRQVPQPCGGAANWVASPPALGRHPPRCHTPTRGLSLSVHERALLVRSGYVRRGF